MKRSWLVTLLLVIAVESFAQQADSLLLKNDPIFAEFDSLINSSDSLSILGLIDSLLKIEPVKSQWAARLGYNSNVNAAGRTLSINKFGLTPGLSYYHKSGVYVDASGYWSDQYKPNLYLAVFSAGYLGSITKRWSILGEYSRFVYFYKDTSVTEQLDRATTVTYPANTPYTNNLQLTNYFDAGKVTFRLDYSLLFGKQTVHRIAPVVSLNLSKKKIWGLDRISFFPSVGLLYGSEIIPEQYVTTYELISDRPLEIIYRYRNGLPIYRKREYTVPAEELWGIMNYAINVPISVSVKDWTFMTSYTYNFPQSLPGEDLQLTHSGYLSLSITKYFEF